MPLRLARNAWIWLIGILALCFLSQGSAHGGTEPVDFPHLKITRYLSPWGKSELALSCYSAKEKTGYRCDVVKSQNGKTVAAAPLGGEAVSTLLSQFFANLPKGWNSDGVNDPALGWNIHYGDHASQGLVPRFEEKTSWPMKSALLTLEAGLDMAFY